MDLRSRVSLGVLYGFVSGVICSGVFVLLPWILGAGDEIPGGWWLALVYTLGPVVGGAIWGAVAVQINTVFRAGVLGTLVAIPPVTGIIVLDQGQLDWFVILVTALVLGFPFGIIIRYYLSGFAEGAEEFYGVD